MNVTFLLKDEAHQEKFDTMWKAAGISGLAGHRSVGGYRASMYNALPLESVQVLVDVMKELENKIICLPVSLCTIQRNLSTNYIFYVRR